MTQPIDSGPRRDGDCWVLAEGVAMPPRCPLCNSAEVESPVEVRFAAQRKGGAAGKVVSRGIDLVKGWNYTGPVSVRIPFCRRHRARRTYALAAGLGLAAVGAVATYAVIQAKTKGVINLLAFGPLVIGLVVTFATLSGVLNLWFKPRRFDDRTVWVEGASADYLSSLAPLPPG